MTGPSANDHRLRTLVAADKWVSDRTQERETFTEYMDRKRREELE